MVELSSFNRRLKTKPWIVIDSSIILASGAPGFIHRKQCENYLMKANKTYQPFITQPIMGELFKELIEVKDTNLAISAFQFVKDLITNFRFVPHMHLNQKDLDTLKEHFSVIPYDDRLHIAHICKANRVWAKPNGALSNISFATIDSKITDPDIRRYLSSRMSIEIIDPLSLSL